MALACFTFDNLGEAAEIGEGLRPDAVDPDGHPSLMTGLPKILELLGAHEVPASFFVEGWNGAHHPEDLRSIATAGHEVGMHGWLHEPWASLPLSEERHLAEQATGALAAALGESPVGFRAPGGATTPQTEQILAGLGYRYDASLDPDGGRRPRRLAAGMPCLPFVWPAVDGYWYLRPEPEAPELVRDGWLRVLEREAAEDGFFLLICHPFLTGIDEHRLAALAAVIERAVGDPRVEILTLREVAGRLP